MAELKMNPDIMVATPGRLIDFYNMGIINFSNIEAVCLDEADYLLEMGFSDDIEFILERVFSSTDVKPQTLLFSATIPDWVKKIASKYMDESWKLI